MYNTLKEHLTEAKASKNRAASTDIIGAIDAVDKKVFKERKVFEKTGGIFVIPDAVVTAVLKNQVKNTSASQKEAIALVGSTPATDAMSTTIELLKSFLPDAVIGDDLRMIIQGLGAENLGQAMGMLKKLSVSQGFDYDGREASLIAKEIFL